MLCAVRGPTSWQDPAAALSHAHTALLRHKPNKSVISEGCTTGFKWTQMQAFFFKYYLFYTE